MSELISTLLSDIKDETVSSLATLQKGKRRSVCPRYIFPSSCPILLQVGNKVGKSWAGPLTSELHFPSSGSAAGGSPVPLWGQEPREPCVSSWGIRDGRTSWAPHHITHRRALRGPQCLLRVRWQPRDRCEQRGKHPDSVSVGFL